jgi:hypothetical protein
MDSKKLGGVDRRKALECMMWGGTGLVWTLSGGTPAAKIIGEAQAASTGFSFVQISDSHIGFDKPANPNALGTLEEAIAKVDALRTKPAFMIHTGDITHLSKPQQFDDAEQRIARAKLDVHYVPGEHDVIDEGAGKAYLDRYGKLSKGKGWYSFDHGGVHFVGINNVYDLKAGGMGNLGPEQLAWLGGRSEGKKCIDADRRLRACSPVDHCRRLGVGHARFCRGASTARPLWFGYRAERPHSSAHAEGRGQCDVPYGALDCLSAAGARHCALARPETRSGR